MTIRNVVVLAALVAAAAWNLSGQGLPISSDRLLKAADEPGNCRRVKQVSAVFQAAPDARASLREEEGEVVLREARVTRYRAEGETGQLQRLTGRQAILEGDFDLEERRVTGGALGAQDFD